MNDVIGYKEGIGSLKKKKNMWFRQKRPWLATTSRKERGNNILQQQNMEQVKVTAKKQKEKWKTHYYR